MKNNKAPGPDMLGYIIKGDLMPTFHDLFNGHLQLFKLNFGTITLLPKK